MKMNAKLMSVALCAMALVSCTKVVAPAGEQQPIRFVTGLQLDFLTKSNGVEFEANDDFSLFAGEPINASNVRMVYNGTELVPEFPVYWGAGQTAASGFTAYYPYRNDYETEGFTFTIAEDQTNATQYYRSDLMRAVAVASPADGIVELDFNHILSKVVINVVNEVGYDIQNVKINGVCVSTDLAQAVGEPSSVYANCVSGNVFQAILVPQTCRLSIVVNTKDGAAIEFTRKDDFQLKSGKVYTATLDLGTPTSFSLNMLAWESDGQIDFNGTATGENQEGEDAPVVDPLEGVTVVDLGLSVLWATCNLGASEPQEPGDTYCWGETTPSPYWKNWSDYKWCNGTRDNFTKYCTNPVYGNVDNRTTLELSDDAAHVALGGNWRMPTYNEYRELVNNTTTAIVRYNGKVCMKVTSKKHGYEDKYIIMPQFESFVYYWTSLVSTKNS